MASTVVAVCDGGNLEPLLENDAKSQTGNSLPEKFESRVSTTLWRLQSPRSQANSLSRTGKSIPLPPPFSKSSPGTCTLLKASLALAMYLLLATLTFSLLKQELRGATSTSVFVDAMYFAIVTMTTVGYGDLVPQGTTAKLFTCFFVVLGFGLVGALVSGAANYLVEKQETILVQKFHKSRGDGGDEIVEDEDVAVAIWKAVVAGLAVAVLFVVGVVVLVYYEGMEFVDAFYCACVTVTALGYGDQSFRTEWGRLFAVVWILASTVCVGQFFLYVAESRTEQRQRELAVWALSRPTTPSDLEAADLDGDGVVSAAEFVIYKLKELGKIDEDDVQDVMKQFRALDCDHSGALNMSDIANSTSASQPAHAA